MRCCSGGRTISKCRCCLTEVSRQPPRSSWRVMTRAARRMRYRVAQFRRRWVAGHDLRSGANPPSAGKGAAIDGRAGEPVTPSQPANTGRNGPVHSGRAVAGAGRLRSRPGRTSPKPVRRGRRRAAVPVRRPESADGRPRTPGIVATGRGTRTIRVRRRKSDTGLYRNCRASGTLRRTGSGAPLRRGHGQDRTVGTVEPVVGQEFLGVVAERACREGIGEDERHGGGAQMYRSRGGGREGGVAGARRISGKTGEVRAVVVPIRFRAYHEIESAPKRRAFRRRCGHSGRGRAARPGGHCGRFRVSRVPGMIRQVRVSPTVFWRR